MIKLNSLSIDSFSFVYKTALILIYKILFEENLIFHSSIVMVHKILIVKNNITSY